MSTAEEGARAVADATETSRTTTEGTPYALTPGVHRPIFLPRDIAEANHPFGAAGTSEFGFAERIAVGPIDPMSGHSTVFVATSTGESISGPIHNTNGH
jgi:hypothetical protein